MSFMLKPLENLPGFSNAATKYIYELHEGSSGDAGLLSVKGANLCEANRLGYLVPPAFILTTEAATKYSQEDKGQLDSNLVLEIAASIEKLEFATGHKFGSTEGRVPLLLTIRGGSSFSTENIVGTEEKDLSISTINNEMMDVLGAPDSWCIPGVKESCLGIGLTDRVASHLATLTSTTFAYNAYAHFLIRFGTLVLGIPRSRYRKILNDFTSSTGKTNDQLNEDEVWQIYAMFRQITDLPQDPFVQLQMAIKAMYEAWFHTDAALYRQEVLGMSLDTGLALIVQTLVVGDTGIAFSRNPATGELGAGIYGCVWSKFGTKQSLQAYAGDKSSIYDKLLDMVRNFEAHFRDMVQIEFVVLDSEEIYVLQVLRGRRTPQASVRLAVDLQEEKIISEREAVMRVDARNPSTFRQYDFEAKPDFEVIAHAETASRGVIIGSVAFNAVECLELQAQGQKIILVQLDADHADERVLKLCDGLILMRGGVLSPPATLCRALGKPCVTGVSGIKIGHLGDVPYLEVNSFLHIVKGDIISMNASTGKVYKGACNILPTYRDEYFRDIISWSDKFRKMKVQARVISSCAALDAGHAHECGAEGIGYLSTNFMFTCNEDRLSLIRLILLAKAEEDRKSHINVLEELQQEDFSRIIRAINPSEFLGQKERAYLGVKLLDVSLSTFWSARDINVTALASGMNIQAADIKEAISLYHDNNPEIGLRGCRITALHPEITEMQLRALFKAVHSFPAEMRIKPHIWIPAVSSSHELRGVLRVVDSVYNEVAKESRDRSGEMAVDTIEFEPGYTVGVVLDNPRACLRADTLAQYINTFALDLNALTGHVYGCSKRDAEKIFPRYVLEQVYMENPFLSIDDKGVGQLLQSGLSAAQKVLETQSNVWGIGSKMMSGLASTFGLPGTPKIHITVVEGDHVTDPRSLEFFQTLGVDAVCVPRNDIPAVKVLTAQVAIRETMKIESNSWLSMDADIFGLA